MKRVSAMLLPLAFGAVVVTSSAPWNRETIIQTFRRYKVLVEGKRPGLIADGEGDHAWRRAVEAEHEHDYIPSVRAAKSLICSGDAALLTEFLAVEIADQGSADEEPSWLLAEMFLCRPKLVSAAIDALRGADRRYTCDLLRFGFDNATHRTEPKRTARRDQLRTSCGSI